MKLLMENWRQYLNNISDEEFEQVSDDVFLFEGGSVSNSSFDVLLERYDNKELTVEQICNIWEKSLFHEIEELVLLEEGVLDWGAEKIAQLKDSAKKAWADKVEAIMQKAKLFIIRALKQAMAFMAKFMQKIKGGYNAVGQRGYIGAMNIARQLIRTGIKTAKVVGPFVIVVGGLMVVSMAFAGTAHAASAGVPHDPELWSAAAEILMEGLQAMGGVEAIEPDTMEVFQSVTTVDSEVVQVIDSSNFQESMAIANQQVDALKALTEAIHQKMSVNGGEPLKLEQIMEMYNNAGMNENINEALDLAAYYQETDPELYQEYVKAGKQLDIIWNVQVESATNLESWQSTKSVGDVVQPAQSAEHFSDKIKTVGREIPVRRTWSAEDF
jgi:hypothetical protein